MKFDASSDGQSNLIFTNRLLSHLAKTFGNVNILESDSKDRYQSCLVFM